jgi:hypothetical protein
LWLPSLARPAERVIAEPDAAETAANQAKAAMMAAPSGVNRFTLQERSPLHRRRAEIYPTWLCGWDIFTCEILTN